MCSVGQRNTLSSSRSAAITTSGDDKARVNKLDIYKGDRNGLEGWLVQLKIYFEFNNVADDKKVLFATTYLQGRAQHWIRLQLEECLKGNEDAIAMFAFFDNFEKESRKIFGVPNEKQTAERLIQHITQKTSASDYAARFQEYANVTELDDAALMIMFQRGLKDNVKGEMMGDGRPVEDLRTMIEVAIDLDDKLYERAMERRYQGEQSGRAGSYTDWKTYRNNWIESRRNKGYDNSGTVPMELDAALPRKPRTSGKKQDRKKGRSCYLCGKKGHFARDCRSKNMVRKQLNAIPRREATAETREKLEDIGYESTGTLSACSEDKEFYQVDGPRDFQDVLDGRKLGKTPATTTEASAAIQGSMFQRPGTPSPQEDLIRETNDGENKDHELDEVVERFRFLDVEDGEMQAKRTDHFENTVGSDALQKHGIRKYAVQETEAKTHARLDATKMTA